MPLNLSQLSPKARVNLTVLVAALGYFVDVLDTQLYPALRVASLQSLGLAPEQVTDAGISILNWQMMGMILGGILWGVMGDKKGRVKVLFGSIILYSLGSIANAFVESVEAYRVVRFFVGIGLAGEIGAGITLISELLPKESRGYGTTIATACGVAGAMGSALIAQNMDWRSAYIVAGVLGLALLLLRISVNESGLYQTVGAKGHVVSGNFFMLFTDRTRFLRYACCILGGVPIYFFLGVFVIFAPEVGKSLEVEGNLSVAQAFVYDSVGITIGCFACGLVSQWLRTRRSALIGFLLCLFCLLLVMSHLKGIQPNAYYIFVFLGGFLIGYWGILVTTTAEMFGTNLRATATATVQNFIRSSIIPINLLIVFFKPEYGFLVSAQIVGLLCFALAAVALWYMPETYARDLDYVEE